MTVSSAENREVRRLLFVGRDGELLFERLEALLEVRSPVFLELVVNLASARPHRRWTPERAAVDENRLCDV